MADKMCTVPDCECKLLSKGLCSKHYHELRRHGYIKDMIDKSDSMFELGAKIANTTNFINSDVDLNAFKRAKINTKEVESLDGTKYIVKSEPMSFINKRTEAYNMMSGDYGMTKGVAGYQLMNVADPKYITQAYMLSEAINSENQIVSMKGVQLGQDTLDHPPAAEWQIAEMLRYSGITREFKSCINSLIRSEIIFRCKFEDKKMHDIYYFNPVYRCSSKGVTPRLFIMFFNDFVKMSKKNKIFKYRFDNMANYTLTWLASKTKDYSELIEQRQDLTEKEFNERLIAIKNNIANDYRLNIEIQLDDSLDRESDLYRELF